jgi:hypothetical protein
MPQVSPSEKELPVSSVEELQAELAELRAEMRQLRATVGHVQGSLEPKVLSRRSLLRAAPVVALGSGLAAMSTTPAAATVGQPVLLGKVNDAGAATVTTVSGGTVAGAADPESVFAGSPPALACAGGLVSDWMQATLLHSGTLSVSPGTLPPGSSQATSIPPAATLTGGRYYDSQTRSGGDGLRIDLQGPGVGLLINAGDGFLGAPPNSRVNPATGIRVVAQAGNAISAVSEGTAIDVESYDGIAMAAACSDDGQAILANSFSAAATKDTVTVSNAGKGRGLYVESTNATNANGAITGVNDGTGTGVWGEARAAGVGLVGYGGVKGRGAQLTSSVAPLRMVPAVASSHPSTGKAGDFFVDSSARLWYCQKASSGSLAATWKQLA